MPTLFFNGEEDHLVPSSSRVLLDSDLFRVIGRMIGYSFIHGGPLLTGLSPSINSLLLGNDEPATIDLRDCPDQDITDIVSLPRDLTDVEHYQVNDIALSWDLPPLTTENRKWLAEKILQHAVIGRRERQIKQLQRGLKDTGVLLMLKERPSLISVLFPRAADKIILPEMVLERVIWPMMQDEDEDEDVHEVPLELKCQMSSYLRKYIENGAKMRRNDLQTIALLLTGVVCLVIITNKNDFENDVTLKSKDVYEMLHHQNNLSSFKTLRPSSSHCRRNMSAYNVTGFSILPNHIKDFLLYRHCRSFPMLLDVPNKCGGPQNSADVFLLLAIKSSPENYDRREVLRKTWAKDRLHKGVWIRRVFITGTSKTGFEKRRLNKLLKLENSENQDIIQWDFDDSFFNLTLKQILFLEWMERWCPHVRFLFNGDDDVFAVV
ncbi:hypothetical protein G5714_009467 [Onychostoma macrolepis]|uniref:Hexosyltransferase n=1 Tax=Onychostoma macrolepis TaxID=369639 RepID=A0A7J6CUK8_9TELE|nr:hypothetical protein G5714_009467 [Onychostoma macrolepis]